MMAVSARGGAIEATAPLIGRRVLLRLSMRGNVHDCPLLSNAVKLQMCRCCRSLLDSFVFFKKKKLRDGEVDE